MKILFLLTYYSPHWTGLTQYARRLAEGLVSDGSEVRVLTTQYQKNLAKEEIIKGVKVIRDSVVLRLSRTMISLSIFFSILREIANTDLIIVYLPFAEVAFAALVAKIFGKKFYVVHNGDLKLRQGFLNYIIESIYNVMTRIAFSLSYGIIIQTEDYAKSSRLLSSYQKKWHVILPLFDPLSPNPSKCTELEKKVPLKTKSGKKKIVGFAGRFVEEKGFDLLLKAMPLVREKLPDVQFVFAGELKMVYEDFYAQNKHLIEENKNHLTILGRLTNEQIACFYSFCDVIAIPSRSDCFPSVEVEALLSGVPVVVTNIPGARWAVKVTEMGKIVPPENVQKLAGAIIEVLLHRESYVKKRHEVLKRFDYRNTLNEYLKLFKIKVE